MLSARYSEDDSVCRNGSISLDLETRQLTGPCGAVRLAPTAFAILERLMRKPGAIVSRDMFMTAMYPDADDEPDTAVEVLRSLLSELRGTIRTLGDRNVTIVAEAAGAGYVMKPSRQVKWEPAADRQAVRAA